MTLNAGTNLGPYEIAGHIGAGGMGDVYRAKDSRLGRDVAIKVSAERFTERFEREARTVAALNHPNICTLHDVGPNYLVMELIEGPTLAERIAQGPISIDEALDTARQIAAALGAAHEKGIIHRDLKPGNVKIKPDGTVKVLDFGLAKLGGTPTASLEDSPTISMAATQAGIILGTAAYMSPEQARGKAVDKRTDIWAFGAVLFEMLTGCRLYDGTDVTETLAAVIKEEPDWNRVPPKVRRLLRRCLEKNPKQRLQDIGDIELLLEEEAPQARTTRLPWVVAASLAVGFAITAWGWWQAARPSESESVRFVVLPPERGMFDSGSGAGASYNAGSISPDGRKLAFTVRDSSGKIRLWVRSLDSLNPEPLPGTDGASVPFWSPDSRSIAFFAGGKLKRIEAGGGPVQTLSDIAAARGGAWSPQGIIVFTRLLQGPLYRVPASGGEVTLATTLTPQQRNHRSPSFLPDGDHFLYFAIGSSEGASGIFIGSLSQNTTVRLTESDSGAVYSPPGYLLFVRQTALVAQKLDLKALQLIGPAIPIAESVASIQGGSPHTVSLNGTLVYRTGVGAQSMQLAWFDRAGRMLQTVVQPGGYISPSLAPNGRQFAVHRHEANGGDIWLIEGQTVSRWTFDASRHYSNPIWSPDGRAIAFGSMHNGKWAIYQKRSDGTGDEQLLIEPDAICVPMSWSPDGKYLVYSVLDSKGSSDLWALPLMGDRKPFAITQTPFSENHAQVSPDGKWIAFNSDATGINQIYVKPFPSGPGEWQASTTGGIFARWRRDGRELFFLETSDAGRMMATTVKVTGNAVQFTTPQALFNSNHLNIAHATNYHAYDVSADGERFLLAPPEGLTVADPANATPITVVLNWTALLKGK